MQHLSETIAIGLNNSKTIATAIEIPEEKIDFYLDQYQDLYPANFRSWHAKFIKQHGTEMWERCAKLARADGKDKPRYFSWLLKQKAKELVSPSLGAR